MEKYDLKKQSAALRGDNNQNTAVPIGMIIKQLDEYFSREDIEGAGRHLEYWEAEARKVYDRSGLLSILNEEIGYYRRASDKDKGLSAVREAIFLIENGKMEQSASIGTIYVNAATTLKAFGNANEALPYYKKAENILRATTDRYDYRLAALYNNMALTQTELGLIEEAHKSYGAALKILRADGTHDAEIAVTHVNIAHLYESVGIDKNEIDRELESAWDILAHGEIPHDGNYAFVCSKCAPSFEHFCHNERSEFLMNEAKRVYGKN